MSPIARALPLALYLVSSPALAGTVLVEATLAAEVHLEGVPMVRTYGPGSVTLPDMKEGEYNFQVWRRGNPTEISVKVPNQGRVRLMIGDETLSTDAAPETTAAVEGAAPPVVLFKASPDQHFGVLIDGKRVASLHPEHPLKFEALGPGTHTIELRSVDYTTVWSRGELQLQPGDDLALTVTEGKPVEAFGREGAWKPR